MWVGKTGSAEMSNLVGLGGTPNQGDSERGNNDYYPCEIRVEGGKWGVIVQDKDTERYEVDSVMKGKGEWACVFHRKRWNEEQAGKSDV